jgi:methyl-accepting chemotaxis protein
MTPDQAQIFETYGVVIGMAILVVITALANADKIGGWLARLIDRLFSRKEKEQDWERDWQSTLAQNGQSTRQRLLEVYERIGEEERKEKRRLQEQFALERAEMRRWREEEQEKQDRLSAVMLDTVQTATVSIDSFSQGAREQVAILQEIKDSLVEVKVALQQSAFVNSQLVFLVNQIKGTSLEGSPGDESSTTD